MKKFICMTLAAATLMTANVQKAKAAEVVMITTVGLVATIAITGLGYAGYGSGLLTIELSGRNKVSFPMAQYEKSLDIVASGDTSLIDQDIREFLTSARNAEPQLEQATDLQILTAVVDAVNEQ